MGLSMSDLQQLAQEEELKKKDKPRKIGNNFLLLRSITDGEVLVNINHIQTIFPVERKKYSSIYFVNEQDSLTVKHSFEDIVSELKFNFK